jgi:hypothetical protein
MPYDTASVDLLDGRIGDRLHEIESRRHCRG